MQFNKALYRPPSGKTEAPEGEGGKIVNCSSNFLMDKPHEEMLSLGMEKAELQEGILVDTI